MALQVDEKPDVQHDEAAFEPPVQLVVQTGVPSVEERRLLRKLDRRILPITCLMYLFACQYFEFDRFYINFLNSLPRPQTWTEVIWVTHVYRA